jgi:N-acetylneuraminic acid mutarotase
VEGLSYVYDGLEPGLTESELLEVKFLVAAVDGDGNISDNAPAAMQSSFSVVIDSAHQVLTRGSDIHCRLRVQRPAGEFSVQLSSRGPNADTSWFSPTVTHNVVDTLLPTGDASSWDSVLIRVEAPGAGTIDTAMLVDIRPEPIILRVTDSTTSSITVSWDQPTEMLDFDRYLLRIIGHDSTHVVTIPERNILQYEYTHLQNGAVRFSPAIRDTEGLTSVWSDTVSGSIINSPPQFADQAGAFNDTITAGRPWSHTFSADDPNKDRFSIELVPTLIEPLKKLTLNEETLSWSTELGDTGSYATSLVVKDTLGAADTMRLLLEVVIRDTVIEFENPIPTLRVATTANVVNNRLFILGGRKKVSNPFFPGAHNTIVTNDVDILDISTRSWTLPAVSMPRARTNAASAVAGALIYQIGGLDKDELPLADVSTYNPSTSEWVNGPSLPYPIYGAAACALNETIYLTGGVKAPLDGEKVPNEQIFALQPNSTTWESVGELLTPRMFHCAVGLHGSILIAGGTNETMLVSQCESYDPETRQSTTSDELRTSRRSAALAVVDRKAYLLGGSDIADVPLASVEVYEPSQGIWTEAPKALLKPRSSHSGSVIGGKIYIVGGTRAASDVYGADPTNVVEVYHP